MPDRDCGLFRRLSLSSKGDEMDFLGIGGLLAQRRLVELLAEEIATACEPRVGCQASTEILHMSRDQARGYIRALARHAIGTELAQAADDRQLDAQLRAAVADRAVTRIVETVLAAFNDALTARQRRCRVAA